ncbi:hypothetical protein PIB30_006945 [Stylosanthes scabra]|uniref:Uncharacterized protein n=1 Tax=Stylosanthes scabra TaxID=79078 RepID=A0ABU6Y2K2_9FABA|nr:hypothetical protein [Stylosanthes scabra]
MRERKCSFRGEALGRVRGLDPKKSLTYGPSKLIIDSMVRALLGRKSGYFCTFFERESSGSSFQDFSNRPIINTCTAPEVFLPPPGGGSVYICKRRRSDADGLPCRSPSSAAPSNSRFSVGVVGFWRWAAVSVLGRSGMRERHECSNEMGAASMRGYFEIIVGFFVSLSMSDGKDDAISDGNSVDKI